MSKAGAQTSESRRVNDEIRDYLDPFEVQLALMKSGVCQTAAYDLANTPHSFVMHYTGKITLLKGAEHACPAYSSIENLAKQQKQANELEQTSTLEVQISEEEPTEIAKEIADFSRTPGCSILGDLCAPPKRISIVYLSQLRFNTQRQLGLNDRDNPYNSSHSFAEHLESTLNERP
jgi:hypothetical protein